MGGMWLVHVTALDSSPFYDGGRKSSVRCGAAALIYLFLMSVVLFGRSYLGSHWRHLA